MFRVLLWSLPLMTGSFPWDFLKLGKSNEIQVNTKAMRSVLGSFDRDFAEYMVNHSRATYCPAADLKNWTCSICKDLEPFVPYFVNNEDSQKYSKHVGFYVGYSPKYNHIIVCFRGSDYLVNFIQDLQYYKVDANYPICENISLVHERRLPRAPGPTKKKSCRVHSGFYEDWMHAKPFVLNATLTALGDHPDARVLVTGHSLGGAIACLGALELSLALNRRDVVLLTMGEPRVGNVYFADFVHAWVPSAQRLVHQDDAVPHLPPQGNELLLLTAFHHHGQEVWQTGSRDDEFVLCDPGGEDPKCSNGLMPWDRSVEAHKWYLGWQMHCGA